MFAHLLTPELTMFDQPVSAELAPGGVDLHRLPPGDVHAVVVAGRQGDHGAHQGDQQLGQHCEVVCWAATWPRVAVQVAGPPYIPGATCSSPEDTGGQL